MYNINTSDINNNTNNNNSVNKRASVHDINVNGILNNNNNNTTNTNNKKTKNKGNNDNAYDAMGMPRFQVNLNFNIVMAKMEQNVKTISSAFKVKKEIAKNAAAMATSKFSTYFGDEEVLQSLPKEYFEEV